jgi:hypothetical protein
MKTRHQLMNKRARTEGLVTIGQRICKSLVALLCIDVLQSLI